MMFKLKMFLIILICHVASQASATDTSKINSATFNVIQKFDHDKYQKLYSLLPNSEDKSYLKILFMKMKSKKAKFFIFGPHMIIKEDKKSISIELASVNPLRIRVNQGALLNINKNSIKKSLLGKKMAFNWLSLFPLAIAEVDVSELTTAYTELQWAFLYAATSAYLVSESDPVDISQGLQVKVTELLNELGISEIKCGIKESRYSDPKANEMLMYSKRDNLWFHVLCFKEPDVKIGLYCYRIGTRRTPEDILNSDIGKYTFEKKEDVKDIGEEFLKSTNLNFKLLNGETLDKNKIELVCLSEDGKYTELKIPTNIENQTTSRINSQIKESFIGDPKKPHCKYQLKEGEQVDGFKEKDSFRLAKFLNEILSEQSIESRSNYKALRKKMAVFAKESMDLNRDDYYTYSSLIACCASKDCREEAFSNAPRIEFVDEGKVPATK